MTAPSAPSTLSEQTRREKLIRSSAVAESHAERIVLYEILTQQAERQRRESEAPL